LPVSTAKGKIGCGRSPMDDATELFSLGIHDPQPPGAAAINIAFDIDLHTVRHTGFVAAQIDKYAIAGFGERAVWCDVKSADVTATGVVDVEHALVGREGEPIGDDEIVGQQRQRAEIGSYTVDPRKSQVPLLRRIGTGPWIGEINATVRLDDHVIGP